MNIRLTPEHQSFVNAQVSSGRYDSASAVIWEGLRLLEEHAAMAELSTAELRAKIAVGLEQAERGELLDGEEVFRELEQRIDTAPGP